MEGAFAMVIPAVLALTALWGSLRRINVYSLLLEGGQEGLRVLIGIIPALVALMTAISMLRASGALELAAQALTPLLEWLGLPGELLPLMLLRPISGSAGLGVGAELMAQYGPDSELGRMAAVMLGCTETTFYTIAVYFGSVGVSRTRHAVPAALCADLAGFVAAVWSVRLLF